SVAEQGETEILPVGCREVASHGLLDDDVVVDVVVHALYGVWAVLGDNRDASVVPRHRVVVDLGVGRARHDDAGAPAPGSFAPTIFPSEVVVDLGAVGDFEVDALPLVVMNPVGGDGHIDAVDITPDANAVTV